MTARRRTSAAASDALTIALIAVAMLGLAVQFDLFDVFIEWTVRYRGYYLQEIVLVLVALSMFFALFSYRRWRELVQEASEHDESEKARQETEQRSTAVLTTIPNLTFRIRRDGTYLDFRTGNPEDLYTTTDGLVGSTVKQRMPQVLAKQYMAHIERAIVSNTVQSFEYSLPIRGVVKRFEARIFASGADEVFVLIRNITNTQVMSEALAASEARFQTVVESLNEGLILTDLDDAVIYVNRRMTELCGWTLGELRGRPAADVFIRADQRAAHRERNERRRDGVAERYETELLRRDGTAFWAEVYGSPYRDTAGNVTGTVGIVTDITQQRWNERLQSALYRINTVARSASDLPSMFAEMHAVIGELMYAKNFYIALHDPVTETISFPYFVDEVDPPPPPRAFSHGSTEFILATGTILHAPQSVFEAMTSEGDVELIGAPAVDWLGIPLKHAGRTFGVMAIQSYDPKVTFSEQEKEILVFVSDHISAAIRQRSDAELFRSVWEHSSDGMRVTDKDGVIVMVNEAYGAMVRRPKEELVGAPLWAAYAGGGSELPEGPEAYRRAFIAGEFEQRTETEAVLRGGERMSLDVTMSFITYGINERMLLSVVRDVTERKRLEEQLLHAQKMDSIGVLAGGIAHDFNNVLAMILGSAELVKHKAKDHPEVMKFAQMIGNAAERGSGIAKQLLLFARAEKGVLRPVSLTAAVRDVVKLLEHSIPKSIAITLQAGTENDVIQGNEDQLHQILVNLAVNARDAILASGTSSGTLSFRVESVPHTALSKSFPGVVPGPYVALSVRDNGIGMNDDTLKRIFEPFYSTKERGKGTGLGLSIVHGIMKHHNGVIDVDSSPRNGTVFRLYFPATYVVDLPAPVPAAEVTPLHPPRPNGRTILVADDEPALLEMIRDLLESDGYSVLTAADGRAAAANVKDRREEQALVISDFGMPNADGQEVLSTVKGASPGLPVVVMTGYGSPEARAALSADGADAVLLKPFRLEEALDIVHRLTGRH